MNLLSSLVRALVLGLLVLALSPRGLQAAAECIVKSSNHDEEFGVVPLGAKIEDFAKDARLNPCASGSTCIYTDAAGVLYESDDGNAIGSKGVDLVPDPESSYPFDLMRGDNIVTAMRKIFASGDVPTSIFQNADGVALISAPCLANRDGIKFQILAAFDTSGGLISIGIGTEQIARNAAGLRKAWSR